MPVIPPLRYPPVYDYKPPQYYFTMTFNSDAVLAQIQRRISETLSQLIQLAESGKLNPWEVKVIEIIDEFLEQLGKISQENLTSYSLEIQLAESGRIMLLASKLILLKAETLAWLKQEYDSHENPQDSQPYSPPQTASYDLEDVEKYIKRRITPLVCQKRKVTFQEFVAHLKAIQKVISERGEKVNGNLEKKPKKGYNRQEALETVKGLAHEENLTELAEQINVFLDNYRQLQGGEKIMFEELVRQWQRYRGDSRQDRVGVFWALLLLSSQSKVELYQREFYDDIEISLLD